MVNCLKLAMQFLNGLQILTIGSICLGIAADKNDICYVNDNGKCNESNNGKYDKDTNLIYIHYMKQIKEAKREFKECDKEKCNCYSSTIEEDFKVFEKGINKNLIDSVKSKGTKYQIINHKLYREKNCMFPSRCSGIEHFLLKLLPKLPNMELIINTRDWPQIHKQYGHFGPVLSFSKTKDYHDIMYPAWAFWEGGPAITLYPRGIGRWDIHRRELAEIANKTLWQEKIEKAFFRGSRTSPERDALILLSRENPNLVDAKYTKNQAWKLEADTLNAPPAAEVSFAEHCKYKYLFNFRGVAASFRFKHILLCKSVVFHVGKEWQEFFYGALKPWIHYVPVDANASQEDINTLISFIKNNDNVAKEIADNGFNFIWNNLRMKDVICYFKKLLKRYAKLLDYHVVLDESLMEIK